MDKALWIILLLAVCAAAVTAAVLALRARLRRTSRALFGTDSIIEGIRDQRSALADEPKSVNGMTRVYLPQVSKDFPSFNYEEFRHKAENMLLSAFAAIEAKNAALLVNASDELKKQVENDINVLNGQGLSRHYTHPHIHRTEISGYRRMGGTCVITMQSAVEYIGYTEDGSGSITDGDRELKTQTRYDVDIVYVQNLTKLHAAVQDKSIGITCPNCGAPVRSIGNSFCEYCGSGITPVNVYAWSIDGYREN